MDEFLKSSLTSEDDRSGRFRPLFVGAVFTAHGGFKSSFRIENRVFFSGTSAAVLRSSLRQVKHEVLNGRFLMYSR